MKDISLNPLAHLPFHNACLFHAGAPLYFPERPARTCVLWMKEPGVWKIL